MTFINNPTFYRAVTASSTYPRSVLDFCRFKASNLLNLPTIIFESYTSVAQTSRRSRNDLFSQSFHRLHLDSNPGLQRTKQMTYQCAISPDVQRCFYLSSLSYTRVQNLILHASHLIMRYTPLLAFHRVLFFKDNSIGTIHKWHHAKRGEGVWLFVTPGHKAQGISA